MSLGLKPGRQAGDYRGQYFMFLSRVISCLQDLAYQQIGPFAIL